jgi:hypothetical protein
MASVAIREVEKLNDLNEYRTTKKDPNETARFVRYVVAEMKKWEKDLLENADEVQAMKEELCGALSGARSALQKNLDDGRGYRTDCSKVDEILGKLMSDTQVVKTKLKSIDPTAWSTNFAPEEEEALTAADGEIVLEVRTLGGAGRNVLCSKNQTVHDLKCQLHKFGGPKPPDQKLIYESADDDYDDTTTLQEAQLDNGSMITLVCTPHCPICEGHCKCADCHGEGRYFDGCPECGVVRPSCEKCRPVGPCKCAHCHGGQHYGGCHICGIRPPCWGGDTLVLLAKGGVKKVRDCQVGDEVRTLRGSKRIARIWGRNPNLPQNVDTEVCEIDGVWITSHHPVISGDKWVFPADIKATALWSKRRHVVPDLYNFELEGHDDTVLLWGGFAGKSLVVSCTIGKYMGPRFGRGICTRRTTRCLHDCAQCDAVYMPDLQHNHISPALRWARFPEYPEVEWGDGVSEFELAAEATRTFVPPLLRLSTASLKRCAQHVAEGDFVKRLCSDSKAVVA